MTVLTRKAQCLIQVHCESIVKLNKKAKLQFKQGLSIAELNILAQQYTALEGRIRGVLDMESMRLKDANCFIARFHNKNMLVEKLEVYLDSGKERILVYIDMMGDEQNENS